MTISSGL